jgi:hypothetical protein
MLTRGRRPTTGPSTALLGGHRPQRMRPAQRRSGPRPYRGHVHESGSRLHRGHGPPGRRLHGPQHRLHPREDDERDRAINHLAPLGWACRHGAAAWGRGEARAAPDRPQSAPGCRRPYQRATSDQGPATWRPPAAGYGCLYVTRLAYVLNIYELTVNDADRAAIDGTLTTCNWARMYDHSQHETLSEVRFGRRVRMSEDKAGGAGLEKETSYIGARCVSIPPAVLDWALGAGVYLDGIKNALGRTA